MSANEDNRHEFKKSQRRRSNFFKRCSSVGLASDSFKSDQDNINCEEEELKITNYINKLKNEKEDWKKVLTKLKKENNEFKEKCSSLIDHTEGWKLLTSEDKLFLQEQPDYMSIGRLLDGTIEAMALRLNSITKTSDKLYHLIQDCNQTNNDFTATFISQTIHQFNEFDLHSVES